MYARLNVERTHIRETHGSRFLNNAHVHYRKCLFAINIPPVRIGVNGSYTLFLLPLYHALLTVHVHVSISLYIVHVPSQLSCLGSSVGRTLCLEYIVSWFFHCLGCAVLLCLVCLFDLACFFLSSFSSLI